MLVYGPPITVKIIPVVFEDEIMLVKELALISKTIAFSLMFAESVNIHPHFPNELILLKLLFKILILPLPNALINDVEILSKEMLVTSTDVRITVLSPVIVMKEYGKLKLLEESFVMIDSLMEIVPPSLNEKKLPLLEVPRRNFI
jgi:hypothetical protein